MSKFKKALSVVLATMMLLMSIPLTCFQVLAYEETPVIENITFEEMVYIDCLDGRWEYDYVYNEETDEYDEYQYWYYDIDPEFYVSIADGTQCMGYDGWFYYDGIDYQLEYTDTQSYATPLTVGTHTFNYTVCGYEGSFTVEIIENPVARVEFDTISLVEESGGYWTYDYYQDVTTGDYTKTDEYYRYDYIMPECTIVLKDGSTLKCDEYGSVLYNDERYYLSWHDEQSFDNAWQVGGTDNTIYYDVLGYYGELNVEIKPSPITSIDIEPITIIENGSGVWNTDYDWATNTETEEYFYYYEDCIIPQMTVTLVDGTVLESNEDGYIEYEGNEYTLEYEEIQNYENQWLLGKNTIDCTFMGRKCELEVEIIESPVESIEVTTNTLVFEQDGYYEYDGGRWWCYEYVPQFTVTLEDGTELKSDSDSKIVYNNVIYWMNWEDKQSYDTPWSEGLNTAYYDVMGSQGEFSVKVVNTPIQKIEFEPIELIVNYDGYISDAQYSEETGGYVSCDEYWYYEFSPEYTATFVDGTVIESTNGWIEYEGNYYYIEYEDTQGFDTQWTVGTYSVPFTLFGFEGTFDVEIVPSPIESVTFEPINCIYNYDGYFATDSFYNQETGRWEYSEEYRKYDFAPSYTITFEDGTVLNSETDDMVYNDKNVYIEFTDPQSYENQWGVGEYEVPYLIFGYEGTFTVSVVNTPIKNITVEPIEILQENGSERRDYISGSGYTDYYLYYYYTPVYKVELTDGTILESSGGYVYYNDSHHSLIAKKHQNFSNQFKLGSNKVEYSILGYDGEYTVDIFDTFIESIEFEPIQLIEGYDGYLQIEDIYDAETDSWQESPEYYFYNYNPEFTVTFKDGTVVESSYGWVYYKGENYRLEYIENAYQSYENRFVLGENKVEYSILGYKGEYVVEILPSPIESIEFEPVVYIENFDGYSSYDNYYDEETGEYVNTPEYWRYEVSPSYTVTFRDGTVVESDGSSIKYDGKYYSLSYDYNQTYENQWGVGVHTVECEMLGFETEFNIEVVASPIESITVEPIKIRENTNGYWTSDWIMGDETPRYWYYYIDPVYTVTFTDGTEVETTDGWVLYNDEWYYIETESQSYENHYVVGINEVECSLIGYKGTFEVEILPSIVASFDCEPITIIENTNGYLATEYVYDYVYEEWNEYSYWCYSIFAPDYAITLNDGTVLESNEYGDVEYEGEIYWPNIYDSQSYYNPLEIGTHELPFSILGYNGTLTVNIIESPFASVDVEDITITENTHGETVTEKVYNETNYEQGEYVSYWKYDINPSYAVTLKDGDVLYSDENGVVEHDGKEYSLDIELYQSYYNQLEPGEYWIPCVFADVADELHLTINKSNRNGWVLEGSKWVYYENGTKVKNRWVKDGAGWCYLGEDGYAVTNQWKKDSTGWCYLNANGSMTKNDWVQDGGNWYYLDANGYMVTNKWMKDSKGWVYLGASGAMVVNAWAKDSVGWCYLGADGYAVTNCWKKDSTGWCYLNANGSMTKNAWVQDGGKWYYLDANGYMVTNKWMKDSKGWVYLGASGAMATNSWVRDSVGWCYVGANGYAVTNCWKKDSTGWCYLNANGSMTKSAWVQDGGKWYYCDANGYMVTNTTLTIDGKKYTFNASGVWVG